LRLPTVVLLECPALAEVDRYTRSGIVVAGLIRNASIVNDLPQGVVVIAAANAIPDRAPLHSDYGTGR
jgi:hypothetical protein